MVETLSILMAENIPMVDYMAAHYKKTGCQDTINVYPVMILCLSSRNSEQGLLKKITLQHTARCIATQYPWTQSNLNQK